MKVSSFLLGSIIAAMTSSTTVTAFTVVTPPSSTTRPASASTAATSTSALHLFGSGNKEGDDKKGPGFMAQLDMMKKAQEMAQKKKAIDEELSKEKFEYDIDGVTITMKYVAVSNPMDPNPDYEVTAVNFDDAFFDSTPAADLSTAVTNAIREGIKKTGAVVEEKFSVLQKDMMEVMAAGQQTAPPAPPQQ